MNSTEGISGKKQFYATRELEKTSRRDAENAEDAEKIIELLYEIFIFIPKNNR